MEGLKITLKDKETNIVLLNAAGKLTVKTISLVQTTIRRVRPSPRDSRLLFLYL